MSECKLSLPEPFPFNCSQLESLDTHGSVGFESCMTCGIHGSNKLNYKDGKIYPNTQRDSSLTTNNVKLISCSNCQRVMYCSKKCLDSDTNHPIVCNFLKIIKDQKQPLDIISELDAVLHRRLIYGDENESNKKNYKKGSEIEDFFNVRLVDNKFIQHILSYPLTVSFALWKHPKLLMDRHSYLNSKNIENRRMLVVHVVGASFEETRFLESWRELHYIITNQESNVKGKQTGHQHKNITQTKVYFFGTEVYTLHNAQRVRNQKFLGGDIELIIIKERYHKALQLRTLDISTPDLIILFQPDLNHPEYKWNKSLVKMMQLGRPIILTSGTKSEIVKDTKKLIRKKFGGRVFVAPTENYYVSPLIFQSETVANDIYRKNAFYSIILPEDRISNK